MKTNKPFEKLYSTCKTVVHSKLGLTIARDVCILESQYQQI